MVERRTTIWTMCHAKDIQRYIGGIVTPGRLQGSKRLKSYGTGFPAVTEEARAEQLPNEDRIVAEQDSPELDRLLQHE